MRPATRRLVQHQPAAIRARPPDPAKIEDEFYRDRGRHRGARRVGRDDTETLKVNAPGRRLQLGQRTSSLNRHRSVLPTVCTKNWLAAVGPRSHSEVVASLPVGPDPIARVRVRRICRSIVDTNPWIDQDPSPERLARLALLRCLDLQREVRRAAQTNQHTAAAVLARSSVETCLLGAYLLGAPKDQAEAVQGDLGRALVKLLAGVADPLFGDGFVKETVREEFGEGKIVDLRTIAETVNGAALVPGATALYNTYFVPLAILYSHSTGVSLLRQADPTSSCYRRRAWRPWTRRSPMHLADSSLGLLALALGPSEADAAVLRRYVESHRRRALPIVVTLVARLLITNFSPRHLPAALQSMWTLRRDATTGQLAAMTTTDARARLSETVQSMSRVMTGGNGERSMQDKLLDLIEIRGAPES